ncbi:MAG TPA: DNA/RNA helicase domain-containing protein, partial [Mucilaginibacter sp.]|nr:DNA/RNA helicase domain-containing protein [Mucilaginibacter sp.]
RVNLGSYFHAFDVVCEKLGLDKNNCSELDWVVKQSDNAILFYDENQSIKPSDVKKEDFDSLKLSRLTRVEFLKSQFRIKGGNGYVRYVENLFNCKIESSAKKYKSKEYELILFDLIEDMINEIKLRDSENGLSRLIAGYSWPWISKDDKSVYDIKIENSLLQWNSVSDDFINSKNALNEVGCIHTTQGYDLNYAGVILGNEITYDKTKNEIVILKENYFDRNGKQSINDPAELKDFIINIYKTIMFRGIKGTYLYICDKNLREYFANHIEKYRTDKFINYVAKENIIPYENSIPVYDLKAAAGSFSELQDVNPDEVEWVELPPRYKPSKDLFACTIIGESMNKVIPNGSVCLFRKDNGGSRNGKIVLVQYANYRDKDFGSSYTVKEYRSEKTIENEQWMHQSITLKPLSFDPDYHDIVIAEDELSYLKVIGIFECVL